MVEEEGSQGSVKLLIADLGQTALTGEAMFGEIADSVGDIKQTFAPAVASGLLDVRVFTVLPEHLERLWPAATEL